MNELWIYKGMTVYSGFIWFEIWTSKWHFRTQWIFGKFLDSRSKL